MQNRRFPVALLAALALTAYAATVKAQDTQAKAGATVSQATTVIDVLDAQGNYTTFLKAVRAAGLEETLKGQGPYTVFAPTDEAFARLPEGRLDRLMADKEAIRDLVAYHVATQAIPASEVTEPRTVATLQGSNIQIEKNGESLMLSAPAPAAEVSGDANAPARLSATVVKADIKASNGVIHSLNTVLVAPAGG